MIPSQRNGFNLETQQSALGEIRYISAQMIAQLQAQGFQVNFKPIQIITFSFNFDNKHIFYDPLYFCFHYVVFKIQSHMSTYTVYIILIIIIIISF